VQTEFFYGSGLTFVNYKNSGALAGCMSCNSDEDFKQGGYTYRYDRLSFVNSNVRVWW
jgi:hypothetical protein